MNTAIKNACQIMHTHGFEGFYHRLVEQFIQDMPMSYGEFRHRTDRATLPLQSQEEALFYSVAYGMSHYNTFLHVLQHKLRIDATDTVLNIIDYGCGQGVATLAMLTHIANQQNPKNIHVNIHLIEPSAVALDNASHKVLAFVQALGFSASISLQNCQLKDATVPYFNNGADTLHLMSYILDVPAVQAHLSHVTDQIKILPGVQHIIATGIDHSYCKAGFQLLSQALTGQIGRIVSYSPMHYSYRVTQGNYQYNTAKAIGMGVSLNNYYISARAA